jgi:hypothetical protein
MKLNELINSMKLVRLNEDLTIIEKGIEDNVQVEKDEKDNIFKKFGKNINNSIKKNRTEGLEKNKKDDQDAIEKINKDYPEATAEQTTLETGLKEAITSDEAKYILAILYILSDEHEYKDDEATLKKVSNLIFQDEERLSNVRHEVNSHYGKVANGLFGALKSSPALLSALEGYLLSYTKEGTDAYSIAKESMANIDAKEEDKNSAITMTALLLTGKKELSFTSSEEGNDAFFKLDKTNVQASLGIRAYLLSIVKPTLSEDEIKKDVKAILTSTSSLSLSCQELMIIEKKDQENAKEKLNSINNFINDIANIL